MRVVVVVLFFLVGCVSTPKHKLVPTTGKPVVWAACEAQKKEVEAWNKANPNNKKQVLC